jgi:hypothetical protein
MKEITIESVQNFKSLVEEMELNVRYLMPKKSRYKWIRIDKNIDYFTKQVSYSWSMEHNYNISGRVGYVFPSSNLINKTKDFKTEKGAKNNLIKNYQEFFNGLN